MLYTALRLVIAATDVVITKIDEARARRAAARAPTDPAPRRPHLWDLSTPPHCVYCTVEQTPTNEHMLCSATGNRP